MDGSTKSTLLPDTDTEFLDSKGYRFSEKAVNGWIHIIIHDYALPEGYCPNICDLLIRIPVGYPNANPDMFWTSPEIRLRQGGVPTRADVQETYDGRAWQRWSRHLPPGTWRPGVDTLQSFLTTVRQELNKGI